MRLVNVIVGGRPTAGVCREGGGIVALSHWRIESIEDLIAEGEDAWARIEREFEGVEPDWTGDVGFASPILRTPRNIFCVGLNYVSHREEGGREGRPMSIDPIIFTKPWTTLHGPTEKLVIDPAVSSKVDWEAELAFVVGQGGVNIPADRAMEHVFGYALANDVSARDIQLANGPGSQWDKGKSLDGFCPLGPYLITRSSLPDLDSLRVTLTVNGEIKQDFQPAEMHHSIPRIIEYLSQGMTLLPGDVVLTGTAAGVGMWREPPQFLSDGDVVEISGDVLGNQRTEFIDPTTGRDR